MTEVLTPQKKLDPVWLKASVVGGLWATVEIIIGSFFHNLRIPFAGSFLAMNGTVLLIAFYHLWPEKGLAWRAGLICALMKSISPSAVILGPMIGIMMEALIIEFFLRFFGKNFLSLSIAGVLSVSSALFHKIASIIILYGFNIVNIYVDIFHFFAKQVRIENAQPITLILIVLSSYVLLGIISAILGFVIGRRSTSVAINGNLTMPGHISTQNILSIDPRQKFSILSFFIHLTIIPAGLIIMNLLNAAYALPLILIYSVYCIFMYKRSLRRLMKPVFWMQLLLIVLLASVNWKGLASGGAIFELKGLSLGLEMVMRAVFIVVAFSSLSVELRNPVIRDALFRKGFEKIYLALGLSFSALPIMIEAMPSPKYFLRNPIRSFSAMMVQAKEWLSVFERS